MTKNTTPKALPPEPFDWQGHRGCRGLMPENTILAFARALEFPEIRTLELDVVITHDRKVLVSHEPFFNPEITTAPWGDTISLNAALSMPFWQLDLEQIQVWDVGRRGHPRFAEQEKIAMFKPTLEQAVLGTRQRFPEREIFWNIELKSDSAGYGKFTPEPAEFARLVLDEVRSLGIENVSILQSFDQNALREVKKLGTVARLALLVENENGLEKNLASLGFQPEIYSPNHLFVDEKLVKTCHQKGIKIIPWTVNEVARMRQLRALGVDGIITDYPNRIAEAMK